MTDALPLLIFAPVLPLAAAIVSLSRPGSRPALLPRLSEWSAFGTFVMAILAALQLISRGTASLNFGQGAFEIILRMDAISVTMALLVGFVGWVVTRYSRTYLDGSPREGAFHGLMLTAIAAVLILVQAGSLGVLVAALVAVGLALRGLLLFYPDRPAARRAAAKFSLVWGAGDAALLMAAIFLWSAFGTSDLSLFSVAAVDGLGPLGQAGVAFLVLAAALKTAAFPLHGWLTEVMEAPTPVSALLHAGIINAGGVLLIRMAEIVQASPGAMAGLVMIGGLTALFGALVMLTQSAVKTALAWSTVSQMGFMLLQCGLGLWPLALLHIVAHSLYKAHAFLASGGAVAAVHAARKPGPVAVPGMWAVVRAFALALVLYGVVATAFGFIAAPKSPQALALGAILIFGVAYLVAQGLADTAPRALTRRTAVASFGAAVAYFGLHVIAGQLWGPHLPAAPQAGALEWGLIVLALMSFGLIAVAQALFPHWAHHPASAGLRVHLANGLYLNALLDRVIGGFRTARSQ